MKILLIDDHKLIKIGIKVLLEDNEEFSVIDDCSSKKEFLEKITNDSYDLFICDISLSDGTGYDILKVIKEKKINTKVIILSMHEDKNYIKKENQDKKVLVGYNGTDEKEVTMSKFKEDINEIRDSRSTFKN